MTIQEAADLIGRGVVYQPYPDAPVEDGVITSVGERFVFVRYGSDRTSKATNPGDLRLLMSAL